MPDIDPSTVVIDICDLAANHVVHAGGVGRGICPLVSSSIFLERHGLAAITALQAAAALEPSLSCRW